MMAVVEVHRYLPVGMELGRGRIWLTRTFASQRLAVIRVAAVDDSLKGIAQRKGEGKDIVSSRGQQRDLVNLIAGIAVLARKAIIVDGPCHD